MKEIEVKTLSPQKTSEYMLTGQECHKIISKYDYTKLNVIFNSLNSIEKEVFKLHYGFNCDKETKNEISKKLGISAKNVERICSNLILTIKDIFPQDFVSIDQVFYNEFENYSKEEIKEALCNIDEKSRDILVMYYGLEGKKFSTRDICKKHKFNESNIGHYITNGKKYIRDYLLQQKENNKMTTSSIKLTGLDSYYIISNFSEERKAEISNKLNGVEKNFFILKYGYKCDKLSNEEIAKTLNISLKRVEKLSTRIIALIRTFYPEDFVSFQTIFYNQFLEYTKEKVDAALLKLDEKLRNILVMYYGLEGKKFSSKDISDASGIRSENLVYYLEKGKNAVIDYLQGKKFNDVELFYSLLEDYSKEQINKALLQLDENNRSILVSYYGLNGEKLSTKLIAEKYGFQQKNAQFYIKRAFKKLNSLLTDTNSLYAGKFYQAFPENSKEEIDDAFSKLEKLQKKILISYYGINELKLSIKETSEKYHLTVPTAASYIKEAMEKINNILSMQKIRREFYQLFPEYTIDEVNQTLSYLDEKDYDILNLYYGIHKQKAKTYEIAQKYNFNPNCMSSVIDRILKYVNYHLKTFDEEFSLNLSFYNKFDNYNKQDIDNVVRNLNKEYRDFLILYYANDNTNIRIREISRRYGFDKKGIKENHDKIIAEIEDNLIAAKYDFDQEDFYEIFNGYKKQDIDEILALLSCKKREIISDYYGINCLKLSAEEMIKKYRIDEDNIKYIIRIIIKNILRKVQRKYSKINLDSANTRNDGYKEKIKEMQKEFFSLIATKELNLIKEAFCDLDAEELKLICLYYGLDNKNIMSIEELSMFCNVDSELLSLKIKEIFAKINSYKKLTQK